MSKAEELKIGKVYRIDHPLQRRFFIKVTGEDEIWLHGIIIKGVARKLNDAIYREEGESITIRKELCHFKEQEEKK